MTIQREHNRKSIRLKGYDYSQEGLYFITICCQDEICRFGHIENDEMILNDAGRMIEKWYYELENKYPDKRCHEMVIMPNHFHCIIENVADNTARDGIIWGAHVGAPLRGRPNNVVCPNNVGYPNNVVCPNTNTDAVGRSEQRYGMDNKIYHAPIGDVVRWFKTMTTNKYIDGVKQFNWEQFDKKLWQRNYYEHIIRNEKSYLHISEYIHNNPMQWINDKFYNYETYRK